MKIQKRSDKNSKISGFFAKNRKKGGPKVPIYFWFSWKFLTGTHPSIDIGSEPKVLTPPVWARQGILFMYTRTKHLFTSTLVIYQFAKIKFAKFRYYFGTRKLVSAKISAPKVSIILELIFQRLLIKLTQKVLYDIFFWSCISLNKFVGFAIHIHLHIILILCSV